MIFVVVKKLENVTENSRYDASLLPVITTTHRKRLTTAGLPIRKYRSIISFKTVVNDRFGHVLENFFLRAFFLKYMTETVIMLFFGRREFGPVRLKNDGGIVVD